MQFTVQLPNEEAMKVQRLGWEEGSFSSLSLEELFFAVRHRRTLVRWHREQRGDDRCWLDDWVVHLVLADTPSEPAKLPEETLRLCTEFFEHRQAPDDPEELPEFGVTQRLLVDFPLQLALLGPGGDRDFLIQQLSMLQYGILGHRMADPRTWMDDRQLYAWLPENRPAITRLPAREKFLAVQPGERHGCPQFIASHATCLAAVACDLHKWGPCGSVARTVELSQ